MRAVLISDIHIGRVKYGKINKNTGIDLRTEDILNNIDQSIEFAIKNKIEYFFILGDFYHTKRPLEIFRKLLAQKFKKILENKIKLFLLLGNHDQGKTSSHDLTELFEINSLIENFHVIENPVTFETDDCFLAFLPHVNKIEHNLKDEEYKDYNIKQIKELSAEAKKSDKKFKLFFAHFGTDKSMFGSSCDIGSVEPSNSRFVPLAEFKKDIWTRVYLGDIHKQQELNSFCRHVGSIARVDFGEEEEQKGFYFFDFGKDQFIPLKDRIFKTLDVDLLVNPRETMNGFVDKIQEEDLSESITRLKIHIREKDKGLINFSAFEDYLKEVSWNYIGKTILETREEKKDIVIENENINFEKTFSDYIENMKEEINNFDDVKKEGINVLSEVMNS